MATSVEAQQSTSTADRRRGLTAAEFATLPPIEYGMAELVHGEIVVSPFAGGRHGRIVRNIFVPLHLYVEAHGLGEAFTDGTGYALPQRDDAVRGPDVSFVRAGRLDPDTLPDGWVPLAPDLAIEVLSPSETHSMVMEKLADYFAGGTALAWVVDPRRRGVEVHAADGSMRWVPAGATLDGAPVLPDFRLAVDAVFKGAAPPR